MPALWSQDVLYTDTKGQLRFACTWCAIHALAAPVTRNGSGERN